MRVVDHFGRIFWIVNGMLHDSTGRTNGNRWPESHRWMPDAIERDETEEDRAHRTFRVDDRVRPTRIL